MSTAALEGVRRINAGLLRRRERRELDQLNRQPAKLTPQFAQMSRAELLEHFKNRKSPSFLPGFAELALTARTQRELFPSETEELMAQARRVVDDHCWALLGFGETCFGSGDIDWNLDPLSKADWPLAYHADIDLLRSDGSDARVLWELNRLGHFITLGRAYAITNDERFATEFFGQLRTWRSQNPIARGANWSCAMEVALRAINLLAAFSVFLSSSQFDEDTLLELLMIFDQHGAHIRRNLEYSHISTSNHYMCDVAGLLWLGITLPELEEAHAWREFGLRELLNEIDKQILPDGADSESSTGYHRLKLELILYSFVLCHVNRVEIDQEYWQKLRAMADYTRSYLRPDGRAPLVGDSDSGQVLPIVRRSGDDHLYTLALAATVFHEPKLKVTSQAPEEILWVLGERAVRDYESFPQTSPLTSKAFADAGTYLLRDHDLYLLFNASGCGLKGRGSHGHNDALSIEVSACGSPFIVDPGSYFYTADLSERHLFRSTAYHSSVQVDGAEQNQLEESAPFVMGDEARPRVVGWETNAEFDLIVAEHDGYRRLAEPVTHRRSIRFDKQDRLWLIEDNFSGAGNHELIARFHLAPELEVTVHDQSGAFVRDPKTGARLLIRALDLNQAPQFEQQFTSRDYGEKQASLAASWPVRNALPLKLRWLLLPIAPRENGQLRLSILTKTFA